MTRYAQILSTGRYIPEKVVTNEDLNTMLGENVGDWLVENVGIHERHIMADDQTTSDLVTIAAQEAIDRAGISAADLDLIMLATDTPDYLSPATASVVQARLGADNAGTYDINCACAAWVTALDMAARYIATDSDYRYILVAGGYAMSKFLDWTDKYTATLFADGAAAVVVGAGAAPGSSAGSSWRLENITTRWASTPGGPPGQPHRKSSTNWGSRGFSLSRNFRQPSTAITGRR